MGKTDPKNPDRLQAAVDDPRAAGRARHQGGAHADRLRLRRRAPRPRRGALRERAGARHNLLLGEGRGFEIAQGRLGPGRIHHCMRQIGVAERALECMCKRALKRVAFGKPLAENDITLERIAQSRIEIDQARLLVLQRGLHDGHRRQQGGRQAIAEIKVAVPNMTSA